MSYYHYDPYKPKKPKSSIGLQVLGLLLLYCSGASLAYYILSLVSSLKGQFTWELMISIGCLILMATIDFLCFSKFLNGTIKGPTKYCFLFFFGGIILLSSIVAIIVATSYYGDNTTGILMLILSIFGVLFVLSFCILIYRKMKGYKKTKVKLISDKEVISQIEQMVPQLVEFSDEKTKSRDTSHAEFVFCHKCGKKLPVDSEFCNTCGTKMA